MAPEFLGHILDKATAECEVIVVGLYNWTEPLLHPDLPKLVRETKSRGLPCILSSNLNVLSSPETLMAENPDALRVSLSGFTQRIYEFGHRSGNIEKVKRNMERLAAAKARTGANTRLEVFYHQYRHNAEEIVPMKAFAEALGYEFGSTYARIYPVEKILAITSGEVTSADTRILNGLVLPLDRALTLTAQENTPSCALFEDQFTLDVQGNVMLCCGCSMDPGNRIANFLDFSIEELQRRKGEKALCGPCLKKGVPGYFFDHPGFDKIATDVIAGGVET
jgi:hypothetical protein